MTARRALVAIAAVTTLVIGVVSTSTAGAKPSVEVLLDDLSSPKAIDIGDGHNPIVGQGAFGPPGPVLEYLLTGRDRGSTIELSGPAGLTDLAVVGNGEAWVLSGPFLLYRFADESTQIVADIPAYQAGDPDPYDGLDPEPATESNPYGLAVLSGGDALVVDAAGNDLLRITPEGQVTTVARFAPQLESSVGLPPDFGDLPPFIPSEAVPTTVAIGPDGYAYVGQLTGVPFTIGGAEIWRIDPDAEGAVCAASDDDSMDSSGGCEVAYTGFTGIQDITFGQNGRLYVLELSAAGVLAFEAGFGTGDFPPARLLEVKDHKRTELAAGQISQPGGIVADRGALYVTDGLLTGPGRLLRIRG